MLRLGKCRIASPKAMRTEKGRHFSPPESLQLLFLIVLCSLSFRSASAAEIGSFLSPLSTKNVSGESVDLAIGSKETGLILYYFEYSPEAINTFIGLQEKISSVPGLSVRGIIPSDDNLAEIIAHFPQLAGKLLQDTNRSGHDFSREYPFAVVLGPKNILLAIIHCKGGSDRLISELSDILLANGFPVPSEALFEQIDRAKVRDAQLLFNYAAVEGGRIDSARAALDELLKQFPQSEELQSARGFLLVREGNPRRALSESRKVSANGFTRWTAGLASSMAGECDQAAAFFEEAAAARFTYRWQRVAALSSAGRIAESRDEPDKAFSLYRQAFELAPLNPLNTANMLWSYWQKEKFANADAYAEVLASANLDALTKSLLSEFEIQKEFLDSSSARDEFEKRVRKAARLRKSSGSKVIIVSDMDVIGCPIELSGFGCAGASFLGQCLERRKDITTIRRTEIREAAKYLKLPPDALKNTASLKEIASALSASMLVFGEIANYDDGYIMNARIADASSGEVLAVASKRVPSYDELVPAIEKAAAELRENLPKH